MRSLVRDMGQALNTRAHMTHLMRTRQGPFTLKESLSAEDWTVDKLLEGVENGKATLKQYADRAAATAAAATSSTSEAQPSVPANLGAVNNTSASDVSTTTQPPEPGPSSITTSE